MITNIEKYAKSINPTIVLTLGIFLIFTLKSCSNKTGAGPNDEENPRPGSLVFPNPVARTAVIKLDRPIAGSAELRILEPDGSAVDKLDFPAGATEISIDVSGYASGIYPYQIQSGKEIITGKIVVIK